MIPEDVDDLEYRKIIDAKDVEIESLKQQRDFAMDEMERLKTELGQRGATLELVMNSRDKTEIENGELYKDIERLKSESAQTTEQVFTFRGMCLVKDRLISELDDEHELLKSENEIASSEIERLKRLITILAETLKLWAEAYGHQADLELAVNALKEIA